jgi:hypothetical protein
MTTLHKLQTNGLTDSESKVVIHWELLQAAGLCR